MNGNSALQARETLRENDELEEDVLALESAVVERDRLCELHGVFFFFGELKRRHFASGKSGSNLDNEQTGFQKSKMKILVTHRKLLDLAKVAKDWKRVSHIGTCGNRHRQGRLNSCGKS